MIFKIRVVAINHNIFFTDEVKLSVFAQFHKILSNDSCEQFSVSASFLIKPKKYPMFNVNAVMAELKFRTPIQLEPRSCMGGHIEVTWMLNIKPVFIAVAEDIVVTSEFIRLHQVRIVDIEDAKFNK